MNWRVLVVDDNQKIAQQTAELIESVQASEAEGNVVVDTITDFTEALEQLETSRYDVVILDVRDQSRVAELDVSTDSASDDQKTDADFGLEVFEEIRKRQFVPIIFYTAVPGLVTDLSNPPFVTVISKQSEVEEVRKQVKSVIDSHLPAIHRALIGHTEKVMLDFMTSFVEQHWDVLSSPPRKGDVAHLLSRRLALSLSHGAQALANYLDDDAIELDEETVHPMRYYIVPPVGSWTTGDVITGPRITLSVASNDDIDSQEEKEDAWYVILTPACDLVLGRVKADFVILVECIPLVDTDEYKKWAAGNTKNNSDTEQENTKAADGDLKSLMKNRRRNHPADRNIYLPAAWTVPDLLIDLQRVFSVPFIDLEKYQRVATLDSPYSEALIETAGRYQGRLGTPDLDITVPMARLSELLAPE